MVAIAYNHVIDFVAENFGMDKEQARQYFLSFFH
jgi:hypothetical protein